MFQPEKKRRKRDGYSEGDYILFKKTNAADFIRCQDPITFLGTVNKIAFETAEEKEWLALDITSPDVQANCEDLKVLGKGDFKTLMKWRTALRDEVGSPMLSLRLLLIPRPQLGLEMKANETEELTEEVEVTEVDEEQQIEDEVCRM